MRDSSPPEATRASGPGSNPALTETRSSTDSAPLEPGFAGLEAVDRLRRAIVAGDEVTGLNRLGLGASLHRAPDDPRDVFLRAFGT